MALDEAHSEEELAMSRVAWLFIDVPPERHAGASRFWADILGEDPVVDHVIMQDPAGVLFCVVPSRWAADAPLPVGE